MRRHLLRLVAGVLAFFIGASVNLYFRRPEPRSSDGAARRSVSLADHPRAAPRHTLKAIEGLAAPARAD